MTTVESFIPPARQESNSRTPFLMTPPRDVSRVPAPSLPHICGNSFSMGNPAQLRVINRKDTPLASPKYATPTSSIFFDRALGLLRCTRAKLSSYRPGICAVPRASGYYEKYHAISRSSLCRRTIGAPQPPVNVTGVQQATAQPNECFQAPTGLSPTNPLESRATEIIATEDCLFLNVYYPSDAVGTPPQNLPTLVWIHGGGYLAGSASTFNGEDIIRQSNHEVVVVIIQYRLGVFGFLPGTAVKANGALNAGLLDQDSAMRWVNQHITKFGGDPSKVTIWGESAGAGSVLQHVVANGGKTQPQLFRGAITSSTFLPSQYQFNDRVPELLFSEVVAQTNCSSTTDAMTCLRAASATALEAANTNINIGGFFGTFLFVPVVDGTFITQRPTLSLMQRKVNGQALLTVTNTFEGTAFVNQSVTAVTAAQYSLELFPDFTAAQANTVETLYSGLGTELFQVSAIQGESIFICPTYYMLSAFPGRSFKGEFAIPPGLHGNDVVYYFPGTSTPPFNNTAFIDAFAQSFTSFIINQNPNIKVDPTTITPLWNAFAVGDTEMLFNQTAPNGLPVVQPITTSSALLTRCQFWESVGNLTAQ